MFWKFLFFFFACSSYLYFIKNSQTRSSLCWIFWRKKKQTQIHTHTHIYKTIFVNCWYLFEMAVIHNNNKLEHTHTHIFCHSRCDMLLWFLVCFAFKFQLLTRFANCHQNAVATVCLILIWEKNHSMYSFSSHK